MEGKYVHVYIYIYKSGKVLIKSQKNIDKTQRLRYTIIKIMKEAKQRDLPAELSKMVLTEFKKYASDNSDLPDSSSEWFDLSTIVLTKEQEDAFDDFCDAIEDCGSPILKHMGYIYDHFK